MSSLTGGTPEQERRIASEPWLRLLPDAFDRALSELGMAAAELQAVRSAANADQRIQHLAEWSPTFKEAVSSWQAYFEEKRDALSRAFAAECDAERQALDVIDALRAERVETQRSAFVDGALSFGKPGKIHAMTEAGCEVCDYYKKVAAERYPTRAVKNSHAVSLPQDAVGGSTT